MSEESKPRIEAYLCHAWDEAAAVVAATSVKQAKEFVVKAAKDAGYDDFVEDEIHFLTTIKALEPWANRQDGWEIGQVHSIDAILSKELKSKRCPCGESPCVMSPEAPGQCATIPKSCNHGHSFPSDEKMTVVCARCGETMPKMYSGNKLTYWSSAKKSEVCTICDEPGCAPAKPEATAGKVWCGFVGCRDGILYGDQSKPCPVCRPADQKEGA